MGRFAASMDILKSSWRVLRTDKELAVIPVFSFLCTIAVTALVGAGVYLSLDITDATRTTSELTGTGHTSNIAWTPLTFVVGVVGYILITFVITFFTAAIVSGAHQRLTGGNPTLGSALGGAASRLGPILGWSVLAGTVGYVLRAAEERAGIVGRLVLGAIGMAWRIVTWLAIPVIVVEGTGPIVSLKRSASLFKKTWGENLIAQAGFGLIGLLVMIPVIIITALLVPLSPIIAIVFGVVAIGSFSVVMAALTGIFQTALYLYASTGTVPEWYSADALAAAFGPRKRLLGFS